MIKELLVIVVLISSFPLGYLLAYLCRDELVQGRKWFLSLAVLSLISSFFVVFLNFKGKFAVILSLFYIAIVSLISLYLSYNKKFIK